MSTLEDQQAEAQNTGMSSLYVGTWEITCNSVRISSYLINKKKKGKQSSEDETEYRMRQQ